VADLREDPRFDRPLDHLENLLREAPDIEAPV
jgi:hypothetical protein